MHSPSGRTFDTVSPRLARAAGPVATVAAAFVLGAGVALSPTLAVGLVFGLMLAVACLVLPLRWFATVAVAATIVVPSIVLARQQQGFLGHAPILGQATTVVLIAVVCLLRAFVEHRTLHVPGPVVAALTVYIAAILLSTVVAALNGTDYAGLRHDLTRELAYFLAFPIGIVAGSVARKRSERIDIYRGIALVGMVVPALSIVYWLWATGHVPLTPPFIDRFMRLAQTANRYGVDRVSFPYVEDSPNLAAVIMLCLAAFVVPPLALARRRFDRRLAATLALLTAGGVLATQSRTGLIGLAAAPLPFVLLMPHGVRRRRAFALIALIGAIAVVGYSFFPQSRAISTKAETLVARTHIWHQAVQKFYAKPLFGQGYHYSANNNFLDHEPRAINQLQYRYNSVHSEYLGQLVDGGIVRGFVFLLLLVTLVRLAARLLRARHSRDEGIGLISLLLTLFALMSVNSALESAAMATLMWLFVGVAASRLSADEAAEQA